MNWECGAGAERSVVVAAFCRAKPKAMVGSVEAAMNGMTQGGVAGVALKPYNGVVITCRRFPQEFHMDRITVAEAARDFSALVDRIYSEGTSVELERDEHVVACLSPVRPQSGLKVRDLTAFLQSLPNLGDDAEAFSEDIRAIRRELPVEAAPWD